MSSIIRNGDTFRGTCVFGRGVFSKRFGGTYAGQCRGGYACGLGVVTWPTGNKVIKVYAEYGPDGQCDGRCLVRWTDGDTFYFLFERGKLKEDHRACVLARDGDDARCSTTATTTTRPARRTIRACLR
jgi:hypothetical protein